MNSFCLLDTQSLSSCQALTGVMVSRVNTFLGSKIKSWLSFSPLSASGGRDSMSEVAWSFPGMCLILRL